MATNPTLITTPFAKNGDKTTPPNTNVPSDGRFSQTLGFPPVTAIPLGSGGKAPKREDFNGAFNMLSNIAFYAQKGWTFRYDASQDYYAGCVVIDPYDGLRYVCISDMSAGTKSPHSDSSNTYWQLFKSGIDADQIPAINKRDVVTTSGTYTAPVSGWYKITVKGGGGGGAGGAYGSTGGIQYGGGGGGEGGTAIAYKYMETGNTASVTIGAGGTGGAASTNGGNGGNSTVTIGGSTYTGYGGGGGASHNEPSGGIGGTGTIGGASGGTGIPNGTATQGLGGTGGGSTGGVGARTRAGTAGTAGGGGGGGATTKAGGSGGNGYVWFEYFDTSVNP